MKRNIVCIALIFVGFFAQAQTIEATSTPAYISIGKWKNANADVDKNIPETKVKNPNIIALIIGNEDYSSFQTGLETEINVDFAENDARMFKEYLVKTLGAEDNKVDLRINATLIQMKQGIAKLQKLAQVNEGQAEIYFYYSGHGLPDEATKEGYIIPVDVTGANLQSGIKIDDLYAQLNEYPAARITVFLDACFSGGARNQSLVKEKGVKFTTKAAKIEGNMVVLTSSTGSEASSFYDKVGHGYFTYFVLKALQNSKGDITYKKLFDYVKKNVSETIVLEKSKSQTPMVMSSTTLGDRWFQWTFKP